MTLPSPPALHLVPGFAAAARTRQGPRQLRRGRRPHPHGGERPDLGVRRDHGRADPGQGRAADEDGAVLVRQARPPLPQPPDGRSAGKRGVARRGRAGARPLHALVQRLRPIPVEAVVRGYLAGSGWKEYQATRSVCGVQLPEGLTNASRLPQPIYTPAAKAAVGEHDENITFERTVEMVGIDLATKIRDTSIALYEAAAAIALEKGMIIADTKFEFGLAPDGTLVLMDEVLTPDSSRYWPVERLRGGPGRRGESAQLRQAVRARLAGAGPGERRSLEQVRSRAAPAPRGDREDGREVPRSPGAPHWRPVNGPGPCSVTSGAVRGPRSAAGPFSLPGPSARASTSWRPSMR